MWRMLVDRLNGALLAIAGAVMLLMMAHVVLDVASKFLFNHPIPGTLETVTYYYMVAVLFLPFGYVTRTEGQIVVELFTRGLSPRHLSWLEVGVGIVALVAMSVLAWKTGVAAVDKTIAGEFRESGSEVILVWPSRWLLPIGAGAMALAVLVRLVDDCRNATGRTRGGALDRTGGAGA